ncbi:MAG: oligosaccharide flippase family protein [Bryobacteraceae bacterium]
MANVVYKATADIVSKGVTLMVTVAAARVLPAADFGVLALAMTTGWILSVASDAGLPLFLAKRVAGMTGAAMPPSFGAIASVMRVRATFGAVAALAGLTIGAIVAPSSLLVAFGLIVTAQLLNAILETLSHAYRGMGRADVESRLVIAQRGVTGAAALATLLLWPSLPALAVALAMPPAIALVASLGIARTLADARDRRADAALSRARFMREAAPIGAGILLSALYFRCDVYFLHWWYGLETVGTYNAAFRIVEALRLFPAAVLAVAFPALCGAGDGRPLKRLILLLGAGGAAAAAAVYVSAPIVLNVLYGPRFGDAVAALRILALALPLFFVNYALTHQLIAWDGQRSYLAVAAIALIASLVANTMLIPVSGMAGAATSTLLTEVTVAAGCAVALRRTARNPSLAGSVA